MAAYKRQSEKVVALLGMKNIPTIVKHMNDKEAAVMVADANIHIENSLPSEKAFAYKLKMEALSHQGKLLEPASRQLVGKSETADLISDTDSGRQVQRYIRLTAPDSRIAGNG